MRQRKRKSTAAARTAVPRQMTDERSFFEDAGHQADMSVGTLIRFDCLLCTGKLLQLRIANIMTKDPVTFATIDLPDTIKKRCTGITDTVSKTDAALTHLLTCFMQTKHSSKAVIKRVPQTLHRCLRQLVRSLSTTCFWRNATGLFRTQIHWMSCPQRPEQTNDGTYLREHVIAKYCSSRHHLRSRRKGPTS